MQGFIEVQDLSDGSTGILSVSHIISVEKSDYGSFIAMGIDRKGKPIGIFVADSYKDIKEKISKAR